MPYKKGFSVSNAPAVLLSWSQRDVEERLGFRGRRHTRVNMLLSCLLGLVSSIGFYGLLTLFSRTTFALMFTERGPTPYAIVFLFFWSCAILLLKSRKLALQCEALDHTITPESPDFILSVNTVDDVIQKIYRTVDDPRHFVVFNRIVIALSNLRNLGRVSDVDEILRSQASQEEAAMETSYAVVQGFIWAIPVLGFIGTVLGLSEAIGGFGNVLGAADDISQISGALRGVTAGLHTAFETTLEALVAALGIQFWLTFLKKSEEEFLDACSEYCLRNIVNKLRVLPFERESE
jgi:biopolymer transport protein ExbB/TolQ